MIPSLVDVFLEYNQIGLLQRIPGPLNAAVVAAADFILLG